jgi:hypothetical protein
VFGRIVAKPRTESAMNMQRMRRGPPSIK